MEILGKNVLLDEQVGERNIPTKGAWQVQLASMMVIVHPGWFQDEVKRRNKACRHLKMITTTTIYTYTYMYI